MLPPGPRDEAPLRQVGAFPFRRGATIEILLVTSKRSGDWIVPKGMIDPGQTERQTAAVEAFEEAGVIGPVSRSPVGSYRDSKYGMATEVVLYALAVARFLDDWPEAGLRERVWLPVDEAASRIRREGLRDLLIESASGFVGLEFQEVVR